jgi:hypothetical protein
VLRGVSSEPADVCASGWADAIVTAITGEIIRSVFDAGTVPYGGHRRRRSRETLADVAIQTEDAERLRGLAAVAAFFADELRRANESPRNYPQSHAEGCFLRSEAERLEALML